MSKSSKKSSAKSTAILSWDVGIKNLAYCHLEDRIKGTKHRIKILDWCNINLVEEDRPNYRCKGVMARDGSRCHKKATYLLDAGGRRTCGFCKTHLSQADDYWSEKKTNKLFRETQHQRLCQYEKKDGEQCGKAARFVFKVPDEKKYYCTTHKRIENQKKIKRYSPKLITTKSIKKIPTQDLQLRLIKRLDSLSQKFADIGLEEVIIENQPSMRNPKMKSIANTLFDYFVIRGQIDHLNGLDIKLVRFICPSNKLKINNDNTIQVFKKKRNDREKYKLTKALGIKYTRQLIANDEENMELLDNSKKKDDLCDAYLQGRYYLEILRK